MQLGLAQLVGSLIAFILVVSGAFFAGKSWNEQDSETHTASASASALLNEKIEESIPTPEGLPLYKVLRVVDGDTIVVDRDGKSESLRLIGLDTPELNDSRTGVQCFAKEAAEYMKSLVEGRMVRLESDESQGERDKYKRLLVYLFRDDGLLVNRALIAGGFGHEYTYDDPYKYQAEFKAAEKESRENAVGLWDPQACPPQKSSTTSKSSTPGSGQSGALSKSAASQAAAVVIPIMPVAAPARTVERPPKNISKVPEVSRIEATGAQTVMPSTQPAEASREEKAPAAQPPQPSAETSQSSGPGDGNVMCATNSYNCTDFKTQKEAQAVYDQCGGVTNDVHKLDKNKDGNACDSLP